MSEKFFDSNNLDAWTSVNPVKNKEIPLTRS